MCLSVVARLGELDLVAVLERFADRSSVTDEPAVRPPPQPLLARVGPDPLSDEMTRHIPDHLERDGDSLGLDDECDVVHVLGA